MADHTHIEWTDATWNPITGCSVHSAGCTNCYAMRLAGTRLRDHPTRKGLTSDSKAGPVWTGEVRFNEQWLEQPLRWKKSRRIFVCAHADLFHENVPDWWIDRVFAVMALAPQHQFQVLTKRADRMRRYFDAAPQTRVSEWADDIGRRPALNPGEYAWPLPNVWLGVSAEDQRAADERIPHLLATPAAVRWISAEPLIGPVDLSEWLICPNARDGLSMDGSTGQYECCSACDWTGLLGGLDWVVAGGESGPGARPMHPDWARSLRDQCVAAGVPFLFKQWGEWLPVFETSIAGGPNIIFNDQQSQFEHVVWDADEARWQRMNGTWDDSESWFIADNYDAPEQDMARVGKKAAGRTLDGRTWDEYPSAPEGR